MSNPSLWQRAKIAWSVFRHGFPRWPGPRTSAHRKQSVPYAWPTWQEDRPIWRTDNFLSYVEEGFNTNALIYSAIMYKVRSKMSAPLRAYTGPWDNPEPLPVDHPLTQLVQRPNPYQSGVEFNALSEIYFNLGNAYILMIRPAGGGLPRSMYTLRPDRVWIIPGANEEGEARIKGYLYVPEGKTKKEGLAILPEDMMHVKLPNPGDPLEGLGYGMPPTCIAKSTDVDNDITEFLKLFFQNGATPLGILTFETPMDNEDVQEVKARWQEMYGGVGNWTEIGVLDKGGGYQRIGANFDEMGFGELDERNESRILGPMGVPPILIGSRMGLARSTYSNYAEARRAYWEDTAVPEQTLFETNYQYYLVSDDGGFVAYDRTGVPALQKDTPTLIGAATKLWAMGVPANQALSAVGLRIGEVPGGDIAYVRGLPVAVELDTETDDNDGAISAEEDSRKRLSIKQEDLDGEAEALDAEIEDILAEYETALADIVGPAVDGDLTETDFEAEMEALVTGVLTLLFLSGVGEESEAGLLADELAELEENIEVHKESIQNFAADIYDNETYADDDGREKALKRLALWVTVAAGVYAMGKLWDRQDGRYVWWYNPAKDNCTDCIRLNDQVHRASEWRQSGWRPQGSNLECGGWECGCRLKRVSNDTPLSGTFALPRRPAVKAVSPYPRQHRGRGVLRRILQKQLRQERLLPEKVKDQQQDEEGNQSEGNGYEVQLSNPARTQGKDSPARPIVRILPSGQSVVMDRPVKSGHPNGHHV